MIGHILFDLIIAIVVVGVLIYVIPIIGHHLFSSISSGFDNAITKSYVHFLLAFVLLISTFAVITCRGKSIFIYPLLVLIFWFLSTYKYYNIRKKIAYKHDLELSRYLFLSFLFLVLIQLVRLNFFSDNTIYLGLNDLNFYSNVSHYIGENKIESPVNWFIFFSSNNLGMEYISTPQPYHYLEIWVHSVVSFIVPIKGSVLMNLITIPLLGSLSSMCFFALARSITKKYTNATLFSIAFLFIFFIGVIPFKSGGFASCILLHPRTIGVYLFFTFSLIMLLNNKFIAFLLAMTMLPIANILYAPTIFTVLIVFLIISHFFKFRKIKLAHFAITVGASLIILVFYYYFNKDVDISYLQTENSIISLNVFESFYNIFRLYIVRIWFFYIPTIFIISLLFANLRSTFKSKKAIEISLLLVLTLLLSIIYANFINHFESGTIGSIVINPIISISTLISFIYLYSQSKKGTLRLVAISAIFLHLVVSFYMVVGPSELNNRYIGEKYDVEFILETEEEVKKITNPIGVIIKNKELFKQNFFSNNPNTPRHSAFLDFWKKGMVQVPLTVPNKITDVPFKELHGIIKHQPMYKFKEYLYQSQFNSANELAEIAFIDTFNIEYAIIEPNAEISNKVEEKIMRRYIDKKTNYQFVVFK